jgi:hypothetical protein
MDDVAGREYTVLRETIRARGTARPLAFLIGMAMWTLTLLGVLIWLPAPVAAVLPLLILLATFETVRALHLAVERIGRYLQVFFEEATAREMPGNPPAWEQTAMAFGPSLPGAGVHPYFLPVFVMAAVANFLAVLLPRPVLIELGALAVPHLALLIWIVRCDRAMRAQRASELARFRELRGALAPARRP